MPLPRCPPGSRRNKKTGHCESYKKKSPKHSPKHSPKKRCPPGSRRNKKTGQCESYKKKSPKHSPKRVSPVQDNLDLSIKTCTSSEKNAYVCMNEIQNKYPYIVPKRSSSPTPKRSSPPTPKRSSPLTPKRSSPPTPKRLSPPTPKRSPKGFLADIGKGGFVLKKLKKNSLPKKKSFDQTQIGLMGLLAEKRKHIESDSDEEEWNTN